MAKANKQARALRKAMTPQEARLRLRLRRLKQQGHHFRRQVPIDGFIVDFACYGARLVIEVDGSQHGLPEYAAKDAVRDAHLKAGGFRVLRFWNSDINANFDGVLEAILAALGEE
jgi:very-short-patch-repair endonuclease